MKNHKKGQTSSYPKLKSKINYLTKNEINEFLNSIPPEYNKGVRYYTLFTLLYDSGTKTQEIINFKVGDLRLNSDSIVRLFGKDNKYRTIPITNNTYIVKEAKNI